MTLDDARVWLEKYAGGLESEGKPTEAARLREVVAVLEREISRGAEVIQELAQARIESYADDLESAEKRRGAVH